jgi:hypothetical protein
MTLIVTATVLLHTEWQDEEAKANHGAKRLYYRLMSNKVVCSGERDERSRAQEHRDRIPKGGMDDDERYQTNGEGRRHMDFKHP